MPAIYLFGRRSLLGGDDLHVPALGAAVVRFIQMTCFVLPLGFCILKQALVLIDEESSGSSKYKWPILNYLFDWWGEADAVASASEAYAIRPVCVESVSARYYPLVSSLHLAGTVLFCLHSLTLEYRIWHWSCQGTPTNRQPRTKNVEELIEQKIGVCTVILALIVGCTYYVAALGFARPYHRCFNSILVSNPDVYGDGDDDGDDDGNDNGQSSIVPIWVGSTSWYVLGALLAISQTAEVVLAALFYAQLKASGNPTATGTNGGVSPRSSSLHPIHHELYEELWADRCQAFFRCLSFSTCFLFGGRDLAKSDHRHDSYRHVAQALADYFETNGTLDVVPTDMFTGLLVLQRIQRMRRLQTRKTFHEESLRTVQTSVRSAIDIGDGGGGYGSRDVLDRAAPATTTSLGGTAGGPSTIDSNYHQMITLDAKTGLRSRVANTNDPRNRSPAPTSANLLSDSVMTKLPKAPVSAFAGSTGLIERISAMDTTSNTQVSSTLIDRPAPPSHHLQHPVGLRRQNIYRKNQPNTAQTSIHLSEHSYYQTTTRQVLNPLDPLEAAIFEEGARMCKYALSIYTWMLYVFVHPITGLPRLACPCGPKLSTSGCLRQRCTLCGGGGSSINRSESQGSGSTPLFAMDNNHTENCSPNETERTVETLATDQTLASEGVETFCPPAQLYPGHPRDTSGRGTPEIGIGCPPGNQHVCGSPITSGDTICGWHKKALLMVAGIPEADLVYAEFNSKVRSVPYCILLDHEQSLVVLSIRGSLSLEDIVTDALIQPKSLEEIGEQYGFDGRDQSCHAGVVACFENVMKDLERHRWLERLLGQQFPDYSLRILGHSLGAGVVTLMGYALRPKYPSLKVFAYSPPGGTMTWDMATGCKEFVTSFVLDCDIVPRLSVSCMEELRDQVLDLISRIRVSKHEVFQKILKSRSYNRRNRSCLGGSSDESSRSINEIGDDHEEELEEITEIIREILDDDPSDTIYQRQLREFRQVQHERRTTRGETSLRQLYPPGKMIHLVKTGQEDGCSHAIKRCLTCKTSNSGFLYTPVFISNDDLDEIVVASTMGTDHFIDRMCDELQTLSEQYCLEPPGRDGVANAYPCGLGA